MKQEKSAWITLLLSTAISCLIAGFGFGLLPAEVWRFWCVAVLATILLSHVLAKTFQWLSVRRQFVGWYIKRASEFLFAMTGLLLILDVVTPLTSPCCSTPGFDWSQAYFNTFMACLLMFLFSLRLLIASRVHPSKLQ